MPSENEIAIVGMSGRFPGAATVEDLWEVLKDGREPLRALEQDTTVPGMSEHVSHMVRANSTLPDIDKFDAAFFGFTPREAEMTDPQHRLFLECVWEALENAGMPVGDAATPIGVFSGAGMTSYVFGQIEHDAQILDAFPSIIATDKDFISTRVSYKLNLTGPSMTVQCACSTSMVALHLACQSLIAGECDRAVAGGVSAAVPQHDTYKYMPGAMLSPDGRCRSFDAQGRGTVFADGVAAVVLMRLEDALAGGYPIRAVILGSAVNNDGGQKSGYTAPTVEGQVEVVTQALTVAGVSAADIGFVEAHGTATVLGDAIEIGALTQVFRAATDEVGICALGSVKSNIGHLLAAAGVAGVIKTVLTLERQAIPACANFETPNPDLDFATSPFVVNDRLMPWDRPTGGIRRAGVSSFGVGGTNAHAILEEAPARVSDPSRRAWHVLPLSARNATSLDDAGTRMARFLDAHPGLPFADVAHTAQSGRRAFEHRRIVVARSSADAAAALASGDAARVSARKLPQRPAKVAFMFTGQGSQYGGMGADLYRDEPVFAAAVDRSLALLDAPLAAELRDIVFAQARPTPEREARLQHTELAQVSLFLMHYAMAELLAAFGVTPDLMIGHSIGEYAAACRAGVMTLRQALDLVALRGRLMGEMPAGTMLSVAADPADLPAMPPEVSIAAVNAPKLIVLAGSSEAIDIYAATLEAAGIGAKRLRTSHAFHSAMMEPMLPVFRSAVAALELQAPRIPYVSSLTGRLVEASDVADPDFWARQIRHEVRFADGCATLEAEGATVVVEVGPGRSLSALARQCGLAARGVDIVSLLPSADDPAFGIATALGRLWLAGVDVTWAALHEGQRRLRVGLPTYPFNRQRYWIDPVFNAPAKDTLDKRPEPRHWLYAPAWKQLGPATGVAPRLEGEPGPHVLVVGEAAGLGAALADTLRRRGDAVTMIADCGPDALDTLVAGWTDPSRRPDRILHLTSLASDTAKAREDSLWQAQERDTLGLLRLLQCVDGNGEAKPLAVHIVSTGLFDVTGGEAMEPNNAPLLTFARVAPQELAHVTCRVLDIDPLDARCDMADLAQTIEARFAAAGAQDTAVALRRRRAWRLDFEPIDVDAACAGRPATRERGIYLITGGLGKVGLVFARMLARSCRARLVLVGRSALPEPETWDALLAGGRASTALIEKIRAIRDLEAIGADVMAASADVADETEMASVIAKAEQRFGRIDGFVHCAGVTNVARMVIDTGRAEFEQNFRSKVVGLMVLETLLGERRLDMGLVVSSLSAVLGGLGHMAYAAANAMADAMVIRRNRTAPGTWLTVNWDAWTFEGGEVDRVQAILNTLDLSLDEVEGAEAIGLLLGMAGSDHVVVSTGCLRSRMRKWVEAHAVRGAEALGRRGGEYQRPDIDTPFAEPEGPIEQRLATIWKETLGLDRVGRNDDFFEIGGHSLMAVQILSKTRDAFGVDFPLDRMFEAAKLSSAAEVVAGLLAATPRPGSEQDNTAASRLEAAE